ncbi:cytochrome c oxidase accessory protein FixG [Azospirillum lipoferum]|uniref:Cytochrome c oxidase accessory protein CcoG n=1 Tax=Azospirillum lipoferum TaxID=193 RepID=A0A5A9GY59_AZOLI|nr:MULTISPECIES: cytochrome c oxidase accessory protein CcoG [Azospirillum]KAA0598625.1 cytochrome c oxidase accessory protein CcoG [Azospirillum lipoferum]MCP1609356.1 cytochrome c oxidase accessory protein FixG [Azospirillum lipoferum]MDW5535335.1 cytochrome c oxidase accessory protein CcoG [Azospirillum sp. NL1]
MSLPQEDTTLTRRPAPAAQPAASSHAEPHEEPGRHWFINRPKVYAADVRGRFRQIKWAALVVLLAIYYVTPWLRWERGPGIPDQAVLIDMVGRRAYFLWIEIWPQEVYYLTGLLILGAFGIFFATTLAGRIWCGYACPQTVWTDLFMWVERRIEGPRTTRIRLDKAPMTGAKLARKTAKHAAWLAISLLTGGAWVFYFNDAPTLMNELLHGEITSGVATFIALFSFTTYFFAGWAREQICIYVCPWRSFQSAMVDEDTFLVTYEDWRGEGRGPLRKSQSWDERQAAGLGDCIDCKQCVHVCPTGTDIREGQQISCIGCGLCVDACNDVMRQIGRPLDLVRFDTQSNQIAKIDGKPERVKLVRPRTVIYSLIMLVVVCAMGIALLLRPTLDVSVLRDRAPLFVTLSDGSVQNAYTIKVLNKTHIARSYAVTFEGLGNAHLSVAGDEAAGSGGSLTLTAEADSVATFRVFVRVPAAAVKSGSTDVAVIARDRASGEAGRHASVFMAP